MIKWFLKNWEFFNIFESIWINLIRLDISTDFKHQWKRDRQFWKVTHFRQIKWWENSESNQRALLYKSLWKKTQTRILLGLAIVQTNIYQFCCNDIINVVRFTNSTIACQEITSSKACQTILMIWWCSSCKIIIFYVMTYETLCVFQFEGQFMTHSRKAIIKIVATYLIQNIFVYLKIKYFLYEKWVNRDDKFI